MAAVASYPQPGGGLFSSSTPLWQPPFSVKWVLTGLVVFAGAVANKLEAKYRAPFATPLGFFLTAAAAAAVFEYGFPPAAFAILFFLLMAWSTTHAESFVGSAGGGGSPIPPSGGTPPWQAAPKIERFQTFVGSAGKAPESFANPSGIQVDFVEDQRKRWFVESVLKENPMGVQEKDVATYPVQGASAQSGTSAGNT